MGLKHSYTLLSPLYDLLIARASEPLRAESLQPLQQLPPEQNVLLMGIGSGLDIPHLPLGHQYTGIDLTPAMLNKARKRAQGREDITLDEGDAMALPYEDETFDVVVMHLILAVVPQPHLALNEASRVLRKGGQIYLLDKFLSPGSNAPIRRAINLVSRHLATRTDVVFEEVLAHCPELKGETDKPALLGGWFRRIVLRKRSN